MVDGTVKASRTRLTTDGSERGADTFIRSGATLFWIGAATALVIGAVRAVRLRWLCDDAYITFRYVQNWVAGHGVVYNVGERVEGYTHFLWLCLLTLFRSIGIQPEDAAPVLGLVSYLALIALFVGVSRRFGRESGLAVPMTALVLALHFDLAVWATGGLETALFTFLVAASFWMTCLWTTTRRLRPILAGFGYALAVLTRPDGVLFLVLGLGFFAWEARRSRGPLAFVLCSAASAAVLVPVLGAKALYYGSLVPNTFYAKSAGGAHFAQGLEYLEVYCRAYPSSLLFFLAPVAYFVSRRRGEPFPSAPFWLGISFVLTYLGLFVARVGGDFMFARFILPVVPFIYLAIEIALRSLFRTRPRLLVPLLLILPAMVGAEKLVRDSFYRAANEKSPFGPHGVTDEHWYYTHRDNGWSLGEAQVAMGRILKPYFEGTQVRVLLRGQASVAYYAEFAYCIDHWGLTDREIARQHLNKRGRPGHEKVVTEEHLIHRGIHCVFQKRPYRNDPYRFVQFRAGGGMLRAELFIYDRALMRHLATRFPDDVQFADFEAHLDQWLESMANRPKDAVRKEYETYRQFYFLHNEDSERESRVNAYLADP